MAAWRCCGCPQVPTLCTCPRQAARGALPAVIPRRPRRRRARPLPFCLQRPTLLRARRRRATRGAVLRARLPGARRRALGLVHAAGAASRRYRRAGRRAGGGGPARRPPRRDRAAARGDGGGEPAAARGVVSSRGCRPACSWCRRSPSSCNCGATGGRGAVGAARRRQQRDSQWRRVWLG
jgi:hypothetical protein